MQRQLLINCKCKLSISNPQKGVFRKEWRPRIRFVFPYKLACYQADFQFQRNLPHIQMTGQVCDQSFHSSDSDCSLFPSGSEVTSPVESSRISVQSFVLCKTVQCLSSMAWVSQHNVFPQFIEPQRLWTGLLVSHFGYQTNWQTWFDRELFRFTSTCLRKRIFFVGR